MSENYVFSPTPIPEILLSASTYQFLSGVALVSRLILSPPPPPQELPYHYSVFPQRSPRLCYPHLVL